MIKDNYTNKVIITSIVIFIIGAITFGALASIDWTLIVGWALGFTSIMSTYLLSILLNYLLVKKVRIKWKAIFLSSLRVFTVFGIQASLFFALIAIDMHESGAEIFKGNTKMLYSPINIFTYLGGLGVIVIGTITSLLWKKRGQKHG